MRQKNLKDTETYLFNVVFGTPYGFNVDAQSELNRVHFEHVTAAKVDVLKFRIKEMTNKIIKKYCE